MAQGIPNDINPNTTSGTDLATLLNEFKDAIVTGFSGTSRPANLQAGGYWVDDTNATSWVMKFYDGTQDIDLFTINLTEGTASISGGGELLELLKVSDDIIPPELKFLKKRTGLGQTLTNDELGNVTFYGTDSGGLERLQAKFKVVTTDDTSITELGSFFAIEMADTNSATVAEVLRLVDGKIGFGEINPEVKLHIKGGDAKIEKTGDVALGPTIYLEKKRTSGNGQVLNNDSLGKVEVQSTDQNGTNFEAANIEVTATETQTDVARGNKMVIQTTATGATTPATRVEIDENGLTVTGTVNATTVTGQLTGENIETTNTSDSTTSPTFIMDKQRVSGNGQVLTNDGIGKLRADSTDVDGDDFEGANIEFFATENHDNTNRGTKVRVQTIGDGATALTTRMEIGETVVIPGNLQVDGTTTTVNSATLDVTDANITVNNTGNQATANAQVSGLTVEMSDATDARIGYDSTLASKFKAGEVGSESEVMTVGATQTATNKTLTSPTINTPTTTGGSLTDADIITPTRSDVKQDTISNLETYALTAANGQLCFATDTKQMFQVIDGALSGVGGGLGSAQTVFILQADDENTASDFTGQNSVFDGGGTIDATSVLALSTTASELLTGDKKVWKYVAGSSALNDFFGYERTIPQGWLGRTLAFEFTYRTNATYTDGDLVFQVKDSVGGDLLIGGSGLSLDKFESADGNGRTIRGLVDIPADASPIRFGFQNISSTSGIEFYFDKLSFDIDDFNYKELSERAVVKAAGNDGTSITANTENVNFAVIEDELGSFDGEIYTVPFDGLVTLSGCTKTLSVDYRTRLYKNGVFHRELFANNTSDGNHPFLYREEFLTGDQLSIRFDTTETLENSIEKHHLSITCERISQHVVVDSGEAETEYYRTTDMVTANFWDSTTNGENNFDTTLIPLTDSKFIQYSDTTETRIVAKQDVEITVLFSSEAAADQAISIYDSSGLELTRTTGRTDSGTRIAATVTKVLTAGDYIYGERTGGGANRSGGLQITVQKATLGEYHLVPVSDQENNFSAIVNDTNDGLTSGTNSVSIESQNQPFIETVTNSSTGKYVYTWKAGIFTQKPSITFNWIGATGNTGFYHSVTPSATGVTIEIFTSNGIPLNRNHSIKVSKQGADYQEPKVFLGNVPVNYTQTKFLSMDVTSTGTTLTDLTFNNLVVGRVYEINLHARIAGNSNGVMEIEVTHDGAIIANRHWDGFSGNTIGQTASSIVKFKATATTVTFVTNSNNVPSITLVGNGTGNATFAQITELNHTQETTRF